MGLFSGKKWEYQNIYLRLGMEWRILSNLYKNFLISEDHGIEVKDAISKIVNNCDQLDQQINQALKGFGKPSPDIQKINDLMSELIQVNEYVLKATPNPKFKRLNRLTAITNSILSGHYQGLNSDSQGNFPDWYKGLI